MVTPRFNAATEQATNALYRAQALTFRASERLATGQRINRGADGPADLISVVNLDKQLAVLEAETRSLERADAVVSTADAALAEVSGLTAEAHALAIASANTGALSDAERAANQIELDSIAQSIDRVAQTTSFNGRRLFSGEVTARTGSTAADASLTIDRVTLSRLGDTTFADGDHGFSSLATGRALAVDGDRPGDAATVASNASEQVATLRGSLGAFQRNAIHSTLRSKQEQIVQTASARSLIGDTDFAKATAERNRGETLYRAAAFATLAGQTNQGRALQLLSG